MFELEPELRKASRYGCTRFLSPEGSTRSSVRHCTLAPVEHGALHEAGGKWGRIVWLKG